MAAVAVNASAAVINSAFFISRPWIDKVWWTGIYDSVRLLSFRSGEALQRFSRGEGIEIRPDEAKLKN
ncbi:hypothetical protein NBRC116584_36130 [Hydrogenophaga sp. 5NK40-0174]